MLIYMHHSTCVVIKLKACKWWSKMLRHHHCWSKFSANFQQLFSKYSSLHYYNHVSHVACQDTSTKSLSQFECGTSIWLLHVAAILAVQCRQSAVNVLTCENTAVKRWAFATVFTQLSIYTSNTSLATVQSSASTRLLDGVWVQTSTSAYYQW